MKDFGVNALSAHFGKSVDHMTPGADRFDEVKVNISTNNGVLSRYTDDFVVAVEAVVALGGGKVPVSGEDLEKYLKYCVQARVLNLIGDKNVVWKRYSTYAIPSFLAVLVAQIGYSTNPDIGVQIVPTLQEEVVEVDEAFLSRVSSFLMSLESKGFEMMKGLPRNRDGSWEMMSMEVIDGVVRATDNTRSAVYSICAAFLSTTGLASVLGADAFRIRYCDINEAKANLHVLTAPKSS